MVLSEPRGGEQRDKMSKQAFAGIEPVRYRGPDAEVSSLGYRYYDKDRIVRGKRMEDHLRFAVCYWHTFCGDGSDVFGEGSFHRPWQHGAGPVPLAHEKAAAAFEFFQKVGVRYFCFHDRDVAPEASSLSETNDVLDRIADVLGGHMERTGVRLLWGTANLFSHRRYMAGAATNPDPEVFAYAAAQVKKALEITQRLGGENYVLWGGREGYETLLNTDMKRELDQLGRFMSLVVEHKHKIGFKGPLLIEPKPMEPTKHQYDFDAATVFAFLQRYGLSPNDFKLNIEANHATLAGHSFEHEVAYALANDILGSVDINRGDTLLGWDTDQFPNDPIELALVLRRILGAGGLKTGGFNFDAKVRRQSIDELDLVYAHVGGIDVLAHSLLIADRMLEDGKLSAFVDDRYAGWQGALGKDILAGKLSLEQLSERALSQKSQPEPRSGRQEMLENWVQSYRI
jgi:xylose isomerase